MKGDKPVALWSAPRYISTAFERVFVERDDFEVFHEPFGESYYYSEERLSDRYPDVEPRAEDSYENVPARILEPREERAFLKYMAYHAKPLTSTEFVSRFRNTFIIRDPKYVIASLNHMWPDFTLEEICFEQLYKLLGFRRRDRAVHRRLRPLRAAGGPGPRPQDRRGGAIRERPQGHREAGVLRLSKHGARPGVPLGLPLGGAVGALLRSDGDDAREPVEDDYLQPPDLQEARATPFRTSVPTVAKV